MRKAVSAVMLVLLVSAGQSRAQDLQKLLNSGQEKADHSDYNGALSDLGQGLELAKTRGDKETIAAFYCTIGQAYYGLGDYFKALDNYSQSHEILRETGNKFNEGVVLNSIGMVYSSLGDFSKALDRYSQALNIDRAIGNKREEGRVLGNIGATYVACDDYPKALDHLFQSLKIARETGHKDLVTSNLGNIGIVYKNIGDYLNALNYHSQSLEISRELGDKSGEGANFVNIGIVYQSLGDYPKALRYYTQALKIIREIGDKNMEVVALCNIGVVHDTRGDYAKALDYYSQSLKIAREINIPTGIHELNIGDVQLSQGKLAEAFAVFQRMQNPIRLGRYYLIANQAREAKKEFVKVVSNGKHSHNASELFIGYLGVGLSSEQMGDAEGIPKAREAFEKAITTLERDRETLPPSARGDFLSSKEFNFERVEAYKGRVRTMENPADGFYWAENAKARVFIEALARQSERKATIPKPIVKKESDLSSRVTSLYKQEETAFQRNNQGRLSELGPEIQQARKEQADFISQLRRDYPEYAAIQYPQPFKPEEITLKSGEVLLEYEVTGPKTLLFVVSPGRPAKSIEITIQSEELKELVLNFRKPFERPIYDKGGFAGKFAPMAGAKLYELLLKPALKAKGSKTGKPLIPPGSRLIIVPDEFLGLLPFEALVMSDPAKAAMAEKQTPGGGSIPAVTGVRYVGDDYDITYAQSGTALTLARTLRKGEQAHGGMFVLADPIFEKSDPRAGGTGLAAHVAPGFQAEANAAIGNMMGVGGVRGAQSQGGFPRLEETSKLAESLQTVFEGSVALTGKDANEAKLKSEDLSKYRHLVFATHGILDTDIPYIREPALVLNQLGNPKEENGYLTMSEVMGLKLNAEVVALTACKTGMGRQVSGEGVMGLGRAFQYAGAKNVLVSLWSVAEQSTTMLVESFFKHLKEGKTPREALKLARSEIRAAGYDHPFFWAPFILMGE